MYIAIHTDIGTQNIIFTFFWQSGTLTGKVNMEVSPQIFGAEIFFELLVCVHSESISSFKDKSCLTEYVAELN